MTVAVVIDTNGATRPTPSLTALARSASTTTSSWPCTPDENKLLPPLHNLLRLARAAELEVDETTADKLTTVTAFNLEARYPDFKRTFRQICTPEYTAAQMTIIKELMQWLRSQLPYNAA